MMVRRSVRFRITAIAVVAVGLVLVVASLILVLLQRNQLIESLDERIDGRADDLVALVESSEQIPDTLPTRNDDDAVAELATSEGVVVARDPNAGALPLDETQLDNTGRFTDTSDSGDPFRGVVRVVETRRQGQMRLVVAEGSDDISEGVAALAVSLAVVVPVVVALVGVVVWVLVGRTLRPVEDIRREVAAIGASGLDRRVPEPGSDDEISRLAATMNQMLDRLETATRRHQEFVADASHELRSPLTRIRSQLEVDLTADDENRFRDTLGSVLEDAVELQHLVDDLLHLARSDAGVLSGRRRPVDVDDLVLREVRRLRADDRVLVDISRVSAAQVIGDEAQLTRLVRNLLDNAARHASSGMSVTLGDDHGQVELVVTDDGPGIADVDAESVFERFTRLDDARTRDAGGTGLGLAIARDAAEAHGGLITLERGPRGGARFVVRLPSADPDVRGRGVR